MTEKDPVDRNISPVDSATEFRKQILDIIRLDIYKQACARHDLMRICGHKSNFWDVYEKLLRKGSS